VRFPPLPCEPLLNFDNFRLGDGLDFRPFGFFAEIFFDLFFIVYFLKKRVEAWHNNENQTPTPFILT
jgi:hypothetical protein